MNVNLLLSTLSPETRNVSKAFPKTPKNHQTIIQLLLLLQLLPQLRLRHHRPTERTTPHPNRTCLFCLWSYASLRALSGVFGRGQCAMVTLSRILHLHSRGSVMYGDDAYRVTHIVMLFFQISRSIILHPFLLRYPHRLVLLALSVGKETARVCFSQDVCTTALAR